MEFDSEQFEIPDLLGKSIETEHCIYFFFAIQCFGHYFNNISEYVENTYPEEHELYQIYAGIVYYGIEWNKQTNLNYLRFFFPGGLYLLLNKKYTKQVNLDPVLILTIVLYNNTKITRFDSDIRHKAEEALGFYLDDNRDCYDSK